MNDRASWTFERAAPALRRGDCTDVTPLFETTGDDPRTSAIVQWFEEGRFRDDSVALNESLTAACWLGALPVAKYLLSHGVDPLAGNGTGMDALHWAANRGQFNVVEFLLASGIPTEGRSMYGGTALGTAAWSAVHEPKPTHLAIVAALLRAGADAAQVDVPTGDTRVDALLREALATRAQQPRPGDV